MSGGDFGRGFASGALTAGVDLLRLGVADRIAVGATTSGTISSLSGSTFANGAKTGAFKSLWVDATVNHWDNVEMVALRRSLSR
jgi:hypothetical protein